MGTDDRDRSRRSGLSDVSRRFREAQGIEGYRYELIDGRIEVSPMPDLPHDSIEVWLYDQLVFYRHKHPEITNYVTAGARVFVPGHQRATCPEPDIAAYESFPYHVPSATKLADVEPHSRHRSHLAGHSFKGSAAKRSDCIWKCRRSENTGSSTSAKIPTIHLLSCIADAVRNGKSRSMLGR